MSVFMFGPTDRHLGRPFSGLLHPFDKTSDFKVFLLCRKVDRRSLYIMKKFCFSFSYCSYSAIRNISPLLE